MTEEGWAKGGRGGFGGGDGGDDGGWWYLLVHAALLLAVARDLLDEVVQLLHQLQVAEGQLVRGDAENLPERREGPEEDREGGAEARMKLVLPPPPNLTLGWPWTPPSPLLTPTGYRLWPS